VIFLFTINTQNCNRYYKYSLLLAWASVGLFPGEGNSVFFRGRQNFFQEGSKVVKFHFTHSKLRKQRLTGKHQISKSRGSKASQRQWLLVLNTHGLLSPSSAIALLVFIFPSLGKMLFFICKFTFILNTCRCARHCRCRSAVFSVHTENHKTDWRPLDSCLFSRILLTCG